MGQVGPGSGSVDSSGPRVQTAKSQGNCVDMPLCGGLAPKDVNDDYVKELAAYAVSELNQKSDTTVQREIKRIVEAHIQVVAGTLMHMQLELGLVGSPDGQTELCSVKVWDQPWLNKKELTEAKFASK
ncbi:Cysteine proteinase inhibitor 6 [Frankliniella fusca]|uniref:Cysteine proteinase inhibitor 6 n=1 Tax=Frankliniella fusca TaxID=407009 RepID=A0AAE1I272_9NEOP|nr:Cysteine proteinase inhibitor 6 [Frankliniella fusca]